MYRKNSENSLGSFVDRLRSTAKPPGMHEMSADQLKATVAGLPRDPFGGTTTCCCGCADDCDKQSTILA